MTALRWIATGYAIALFGVASLNYLPGPNEGPFRYFGIFELDIFDDALHVISATWAAVAAWMSHTASRKFLYYFGLLYFTDGLLGLATGSGYLNLGIINYGVLDLPFNLKVLANLPHIVPGAFAIFASTYLTPGLRLNRAS